MEYWMMIGCIFGLYALLAISLNMVAGEMGLMSLCHAAFFGMGAYTAALLVTKLGISPWLSSLLSPFFVAAMAAMLAIPLSRINGDFFAIATFGLALVFFSVILHWTSLTGGAFGMVVDLAPHGTGLARNPSKILLLPICFIVLGFSLITRRWRRSPLGRVLNTIREDQTLAGSLGKRVGTQRLISFTVSASIAGLAGVIYLWIVGIVDPSGFGVMDSVMLLAMVIVGGAGSNRGSIAGAAIVVIIPELLRSVGLTGQAAANLRQIIFGILLYLVLLYRPKGLLGRLHVGVEQRT
ncbi:MAG: branched-chain amino acid ABC transporter permease [Syntrophobacteraceae bacterium]|jgi:branched-chain amino acid transport system permease protein